MRNIHIYIESEYGKENVQIFRHWEKMKYKMADFENHCRFSLRCLSMDIIPVSVRLKSNILTPKARYIVRKAERALLNEKGWSTTLSPCSKYSGIHVSTT